MASSFTDENIDPTLREMTPVNVYLDQARRRFQAQLEQARQNSQQPDLNHSPEEQEMASTNTPVITSVITMSQSSNDLSTVARRLKCKLELSEEAEADLDDFCAVPPEERQLLLMVVALQNRDLLTKLQESGSAWEISQALSKNIWLYVKAFLLSSTGVCYVGDSSVHVMVALRDMKVKDLPPEDDLTANASLQSRISYCLTTRRAQIKDLIRISMQNDKAGKAVQNIAHLTKKLIGKSKSIPQTQQLYMRLSVARYVYASMLSAREDNYWEEVDRMLHGMRENGDDMFVFCLNDTYQQDIKKYGDPAKSGIKSVEIGVAKVPNWVRKINELTPKVQISEGEGDRPAKRRRVDAFGDEDGNDSDDLDDEDTNSQSANDTNHQVPLEN